MPSDSQLIGAVLEPYLGGRDRHAAAHVRHAWDRAYELALRIIHTDQAARAVLVVALLLESRRSCVEDADHDADTALSELAFQLLDALTADLRADKLLEQAPVPDAPP